MNTEDHYININTIAIDVAQFAAHETPEYIVERLQQAIKEVLQKYGENYNQSTSPFKISSTAAHQLQQDRKQLNFANFNGFKQTRTQTVPQTSVVPQMAAFQTNQVGQYPAPLQNITGSTTTESNKSESINTATAQGITTSNTSSGNSLVPEETALVTAIQEKYLSKTSPDYNENRVSYWQRIVEKIEKGEDVLKMIKAPEHIELKALYTTVIKQTALQNTLDKAVLRKRMIAHIETQYLKDKRLKKEQKTFWQIILEKLKNPSQELLNILSENPELLLFLDLLTPEYDDFELSLKALFKTNIFTSYRNIYPKLDTKSIYTNLGKLKDLTGSSIRGINKDKVGLIHKEGQTIIFKVVKPKNAKNLEHTNWKIYKKDGTVIHTYIDKGATLAYTFLERGMFVVEAYGSLAEYKSDKQYNAAVAVKDKGTKSYMAVHIVGPLKGIQLLGQDILRLGEALSFAPEWHFQLETFPTLEWTYRFKATKKASFGPEIPITTLPNQNNTLTHVFEDKGFYEISVSETGIDKPFKAVKTITVGHNWVVGIKETENKHLKLAHTDTRFLFEVDNYRINPATPEEIEHVKWLVFKAGKIYTPKGKTLRKDVNGKPYLDKGASFDVFIDDEGEYGIEAYMNGYSMRGKSFAKISVVHPKVTEASWVYEDGQPKQITGLTEDNYIKGKIPNFNSRPIIIDVCQGKTVVFTKQTVTTDKGAFRIQIPTVKILEQVKTLAKALTFKVSGSAYKLKGQEVLLASQLQLTERESITAAYFMHKNNKLSPIRNAVLYGTRIMFVVETANMVGQKLILALYSAKDVKDYSYFRTPLRTKEAVVVTASGKAAVEFELQKDWANTDRYYYVSIASGTKFSYLKQQFNSSMLLGYLEGDVLHHGAKVYGERAPWMEIAIEEAKKAKGVHEGLEPMLGMGYKYLRFAGINASPDDDENGQWCASFISWTINQSNFLVPKTSRASSQGFIWFKDKIYKKIDKPVYGAIAVYTKFNNPDRGHVGLVFGKTNEGKLILIGGNQDDTIRFDQYGKKTKTKYLNGYYVPKSYVLGTKDELTESDIYKSAEEVNEIFNIITKKTTGKTS